jgi:hypothetical protein
MVVSGILLLTLVASNASDVPRMKDFHWVDPLGQIMIFLLVFPVKLAAEYRLHQRCRLPPESMQRVVMHAWTTNVLGVLMIISCLMDFFFKTSAAHQPKLYYLLLCRGDVFGPGGEFYLLGGIHGYLFFLRGARRD